MPAFRYKALAQSGAIDEGTVTAKDMAAVQRQLRKAGAAAVAA